MDHPVAVLGLEQDESAGGPGAMEDELDLGVGPLLDVVVALVPDGHLATPVLALGNLALEGGVLEGMVLRVHCQVVLIR